MKIKALRNGESRPSKSGSGNYVWDYEIVDAKPAELALYKKIKGSYYRESDNGKPMHFSNMFVGQTATLMFNRDNTNVYCPEASKAKSAVQQAKQMGINVNEAFTDVLKGFMTGFVSTSQITEEETPAETKPKAKTATKERAKRTNLSRI